MEEKLRPIGKSRLGIVALASFLALLAIQPVLVTHASTSYSFNLVKPNTAVAPADVPGTPVTAGDVIRFTGSGTFSTPTGPASGGGSFTHSKPDGTVFARGTWVITAFGSFTPYGGPTPGLQGGQLLVTVTLFGPGGAIPGLTLQVTCLLGTPPGGVDEGTILVGLFTESTGGNTLFHLNG